MFLSCVRAGGFFESYEILVLDGSSLVKAPAHSIKTSGRGGVDK